MNASDFEARLRSVLSDLSDHLSDEQLAQAIASAGEITGISLPTTDQEMVEALLNRGEAVCLGTLQNDWLPRFDATYAGDTLSRADVARQIESKLTRLDKRWVQLSKRYKAGAGRSSMSVAVGTAKRV